MTERQKEILRIIVEQYIRDAEPISSTAIMNQMIGKISSATIRNDCMKLEKLHFLTKNWESSGRVPSTDGYRYYIDHLMKPEQHDVKSLKNQINKLFNKRNLKIDKVLDEISALLSQTLHVTGVVIKGKNITETLEQIQALPISNNRMVFLFITSSGEVTNHTFHAKLNQVNDIQNAINLFNIRLKGTPVNKLQDKFNIIRHIMAQQINDYEKILKQFTEALLGITDVYYSTHGMQYMMENPEFKNLTKTKRVLKFISEFSPFNYYESQMGNAKHLQIKVGSEVDNQENDDIGMMSSNYSIRERNTNLTFIGPRRMQYRQLSEILQWLEFRIHQEFGIQLPNINRKLLSNKTNYNMEITPLNKEDNDEVKW